MGISADTIATSIAALSVSGLTIKDLATIRETITARDCPILFPSPADFMTGLTVTRQSMNGDRKDIGYTLNYVFLYAPVNATNGLYTLYQSMVIMACAIWDAIISNDAVSGSIDITPIAPPSFGIVQDPAGKEYFGATLQFQVLEFSEV